MKSFHSVLFILLFSIWLNCSFPVAAQTRTVSQQNFTDCSLTISSSTVDNNNNIRQQTLSGKCVPPFLCDATVRLETSHFRRLYNMSNICRWSGRLPYICCPTQLMRSDSKSNGTSFDFDDLLGGHRDPPTSGFTTIPTTVNSVYLPEILTTPIVTTATNIFTPTQFTFGPTFNDPLFPTYAPPKVKQDLLFENCGQFGLNRILNGQSSAPFSGLMLLDGRPICSVMLITNQHLLSSSNCLRANLKGINIKDNQRISIRLPGQPGLFPIAKITIQPSLYQNLNNDNSLVLLQLFERLPINQEIQPVCLIKNADSLSQTSPPELIKIGIRVNNVLSASTFANSVQTISRQECVQTYRSLLRRCARPLLPGSFRRGKSFVTQEPELNERRRNDESYKTSKKFDQFSEQRTDCPENDLPEFSTAKPLQPSTHSMLSPPQYPTIPMYPWVSVDSPFHPMAPLPPNFIRSVPTRPQLPIWAITWPLEADHRELNDHTSSASELIIKRSVRSTVKGRKNPNKSQRFLPSNFPCTPAARRRLMRHLESDPSTICLQPASRSMTSCTTEVGSVLITKLQMNAEQDAAQEEPLDQDGEEADVKPIDFSIPSEQKKARFALFAINSHYNFCNSSSSLGKLVPELFTQVSGQLDWLWDEINLV